MKNQMKKLLSIVLCLVMAGNLSGCSKKETKQEDLSTLSAKELAGKAKKEGNKLITVGMPDDWAGWKYSWDAIHKKYGNQHEDKYMTSAEALSAFEDEKSSPTRDLGNVGQAFGKAAVQKDIVQGFKPSTWDSIPDWAKDKDGKWMISFVGTISFIQNKKLVQDNITSWQDVLNSKCKISVGDVIRGASSRAAVLAAAIAFGGSMDNIKPGIDFFIKMAKAGRVDPGDISQNRVAKGEIQLGVSWDYSMLHWRDIIGAADKKVKLDVCIPKDGAVQSGYCLMFNKYAVHPYTTALTIEYLLSDEGQIDRARGYARPIRKVAIPKEIFSKLLPDSEYTNVYLISNFDKWTKVSQQIASAWEEEVVPLMKQ